MVQKQNSATEGRSKDSIAPIRQRKSELTRERLLATAEGLFAEKGYDGTSLSEITRQSGVVKGLFYYYFSDKEALFNAIVERYFEAHAEGLTKAVLHSGSLKDKVHAALDAYLDVVEKNPVLIRLMQREACTKSLQMHKIASLLRPLLTLGDQLFEGPLPATGPFSPRQFFLSVFAMSMSAFAYAPLLEHLWGIDPLSKELLAVRRRHLHGIVDSILEQYILT